MGSVVYIHNVQLKRKQYLIAGDAGKGVNKFE